MMLPASVVELAALLGALAFLGLVLASIIRKGAFNKLAWRAALLGMAGWLFVIAATGPASAAGQVAESVRNLAWLWFMAGIAGRRENGRRISPVGWIYIGLFAIQALSAVTLVYIAATGPAGATLSRSVITMQMLFAAGALVLLHNLVQAGLPDERRLLTLPLGTLAALWAYDLNLYAISYLSDRPADLLIGLRAIAGLAAALVLAVAALRPTGQSVRLSRPVAFRSLAVAGVAGWLGLLSLFAGLATGAGTDFSSRAQIGVLAAAITAMALLFLSPRLRALVRVWMVKHLFEHRYDYRAEWSRFTTTLHRPEDGGLSLHARVVKALADMVESSGGLLIARDGNGVFAFAAEWPQQALALAPTQDWSSLAGWLATSGRIIQFDEVRDGLSPAAERAAVPAWIGSEEDYWIAVPLDHHGELEGIVLLARPLINRALDWEDFDLLKVAGRQAASHLAEARRSDAMAESGRFEEFHRRFAFMMHDVKNLASQMGVLARNAERHGDNPDFRVDMVETLKLSAERLSQLMQRLSQQEKVRIERVEAVDLAAVARRVAHAKRALHPVDVIVDHAARASADSETIEQLLVHLVQNGIDATRGNQPVCIHVGRRADCATVRVEDRGTGMSPDFIRNQLFRPFNSTKEGGFGIGAYQARKLTEAMGGTLTVDSREGVGSSFTLSLPLADHIPIKPPASEAA